MPNFYIAGAARCGSTSLDAYCRAHPDIYMSPVKEPNYFSYGFGAVQYDGPGREKFYATSIKNLGAYQALFERAGQARVIGEASINYMLHPQACAGIKALTPEAKLVFILRQPVERAWSSFQLSRGSGTEQESSFLAAWRDDSRRRAAGHWSCIHRYKSLYAKHLECWFTTFPKEQIKVILYEDLKEDAESVMRELYAFLEVDPDFQPQTSVVYNQSGEINNLFLRLGWKYSAGLRSTLAPLLPARWRGRIFRYIASGSHARKPSEALPRDLKLALTDELRDDILALENLLDRDLSGWYRQSEAGAESDLQVLPG